MSLERNLTLTAVPHTVPPIRYQGVIDALEAVPLPDGRVVLAAAGGDGTVRLWDPVTGDPYGASLVGPAVAIGLVAAVPLPGGLALVAAASGGRRNGQDRSGLVRLWNPVTGIPHRASVIDHSSDVWSVVAVPLESEQVLLASGGFDGSVRLWNPITGEPYGAPLHGHDGPVSSLAAVPLPNGEVLLASGDGSYGGSSPVRLWNPISGEPYGEPLTGHSGPVASLAVVPLADGRVLLASGSPSATNYGYSGDGIVQLWDPVTGDLRGSGFRNTGSVWSLAAVPLPDGRTVLAVGSDDAVRLWDPVLGGPPSAPLIGYAGRASSVVAIPLPDGRVLIAVADNSLEGGTVRLWEVVRERRVGRVPGYVSDVGAGADLLDRGLEAEAIAGLLTARSARPPLAVGVFGQWGEGKSQFLDLVHQAVTARSAVDRSDPIAHADVRQVRFNAWHYAEADLWASLVAEVFAQLGAGEDPAVGARQRSRLVTEVIAARGLAGQLTGARARLSDLQAARSGQLTRRAVWAVLRAVPRWSLLWPVLAAGVAALVVRAGLGWGWWSGLHGWLHGLPGAAALLGLVPGVRAGWAASREQRRRVRGGAERLRAAPGQVRAQLDTAVLVAAAEVARLERELADLTAAGQLAGLVQDRAAGGTYRERLGLMTQIRQDFEAMAELLAAAEPHPRPGGEDYPVERGKDGAGTELGLDVVGDALPAIDRIVLYIDDLDRCPPLRVVEVLEAVHLLLAGRLFVTVVAVDPRWLLRSISSHYRDLFDPGHDAADGDRWAGVVQPAQYLEKIFQIVLTLPPLDEAGYRRMVEELVGIRADEQDQLRSPDPAQTDRVDRARTAVACGSRDPAPAGSLDRRPQPPPAARPPPGSAVNFVRWSGWTLSR